MIAFTFITFFFMEMLQKKYLHPFQYVLVGIALCLFYTLLLSMAEYIGFNASYGVASLLVILLIMWYIASILSSKKLSYLIGGTLTLLYGFIFVIIQLEDYALLAGSFGLFIALIVLMYYSRKLFIKTDRNNNPMEV
jgi:inner membrane protein